MDDDRFEKIFIAFFRFFYGYVIGDGNHLYGTKRIIEDNNLIRRSEIFFRDYSIHDFNVKRIHIPEGPNTIDYFCCLHDYLYGKEFVCFDISRANAFMKYDEKFRLPYDVCFIPLLRKK